MAALTLALALTVYAIGDDGAPVPPMPAGVGEAPQAEVADEAPPPEPAYGVWDCSATCGSAQIWAQVACIEQKESGGLNIANHQGSGAVGVMQYMPSTFAAHAREMGHYGWSPWVPWQAREVAAYDLSRGRRTQWTVRGC